MTTNGDQNGTRNTHPLPPRYAGDLSPDNDPRRRDLWVTPQSQSQYRPQQDHRDSSETHRFDYMPTSHALTSDSPLHSQFSPHVFSPQRMSTYLPPSHPHPPTSLSIPGEWPQYDNLGISSIGDGAPLVHLQPPLSASGLDDESAASLPSLNSSRSSATRSRRNPRTRDHPDTLDELRDPPAGEKPDYSYPVLIRCAIMSHSRKSPTLAEIYEMINKRFDFFKMDDASWKNSVRHYLSISPSFVKVARPITEPGKGNYWTWDDNPQAKPVRKRPSRKRKPDRDDDDEPSPRSSSGRSKPFRTENGSLPATLTSEAGCTPSSSDMGDSALAAHASSGSDPARIASRRTNPAYPWLEAAKHLAAGSPSEQNQNHRDSQPSSTLASPALPHPNGMPKDLYSPKAPVTAVRVQGQSPVTLPPFADPTYGGVPQQEHYMQPSGARGAGSLSFSQSAYSPPAARDGTYRSAPAPFSASSLPPLQFETQFGTGALGDGRQSRGPRHAEDPRQEGSPSVTGSFDLSRLPMHYASREQGYPRAGGDHGRPSYLPTPPSDHAGWT